MRLSLSIMCSAEASAASRAMTTAVQLSSRGRCCDGGGSGDVVEAEAAEEEELVVMVVVVVVVAAAAAAAVVELMSSQRTSGTKTATDKSTSSPNVSVRTHAEL